MPENEQTETKQEVETDYRIVKPEEKVPEITTYRSLMRLLVGGAIEGGDELMQRLRAWEAEHLPAEGERQGQKVDPDETAMQRARYALVGLLYEAPEIAITSALNLYETSERVGNVLESLVGPVADSWAMRPVRKRYDRLQARAGLAIERWVATGRVQEPYGRAMARDLVPEVIDDVVIELTDNKEIETLIKVQVGHYLDYLNEHPELIEDLVQEAGDKYVRYLRQENPDDVQALITDQTLGITTEIADEVRERTVTADSLMEMVFRSLMRRQPRQDMPGPPPEVVARAVPGRSAPKGRLFAAENIESLDGIGENDD
ncbi:MAG: hypothetical protein GY759_14595 [Chloroflexi bacterium]|nr:hypothetical protein [Chloroflexota bacterium]